LLKKFGTFSSLFVMRMQLPYKENDNNVTGKFEII